MGQKMNPNAIRTIGEPKSAFISGCFSNHWYSDFKYSSFFYQDLYIRKNTIRVLLKYFKTKIRSLKGRRRRLKSVFRTSSKSFTLSRLPYKTILLFFLLKPAVLGLQRKHTAFKYNPAFLGLKPTLQSNAFILKKRNIRGFNKKTGGSV